MRYLSLSRQGDPSTFITKKKKKIQVQINFLLKSTIVRFVYKLVLCFKKKIKTDANNFQSRIIFFLILIKCQCKNYLYIYNIKLIEENI